MRLSDWFGLKPIPSSSNVGVVVEYLLIFQEDGAVVMFPLQL